MEESWFCGSASMPLLALKRNWRRIDESCSLPSASVLYWRARLLSLHLMVASLESLAGPFIQPFLLSSVFSVIQYLISKEIFILLGFKLYALSRFEKHKITHLPWILFQRNKNKEAIKFSLALQPLLNTILYPIIFFLFSISAAFYHPEYDRSCLCVSIVVFRLDCKLPESRNNICWTLSS